MEVVKSIKIVAVKMKVSLLIKFNLINGKEKEHSLTNKIMLIFCYYIIVFPLLLADKLCKYFI